MVKLTISPIETKDGAINLEAWIQEITQKYSVTNTTLLRQAASLAQIAGTDHATPNGESCLHQGLTMAEILAELHLETETLAAAVVYSSVRYAGLAIEDVAEHLGKKIAQLVKGTTQMQAIHTLHGDNYRSHETATIDNIRKMLLAMVDDVGVVFIKLAERLCILRNTAIFSDNKKKLVAQETMDIYAPLANRLGIGQLKWQLEDLSFRYLQPDEYKKISTALHERRIDREIYIQQVLDQIKNLLQTAGVDNYKISGRAKHIYSIYRKMRRKNVDIDQIYDISAVRILVPSIENCYTALSSVHTHWAPIAKEFDDYIATPKPNGYRSIHTAVIGSNNKPLEIQIRTFKMHEEAELGVAAHWIYKEGARKPTGYQEKIAWLRQVMDWQKEIAKTEAAKADVQSEIFDDRVYVFTPNGEVLDLPKGATPLDFAYQIHSQLGHRCRGAKINGHIVPLTYHLTTGEQVEILTVKQEHPSRDWLNPHLGYLQTSRARAKVLQWFKKQDYEENLAEGREQIEKEFRRLNIKHVNLNDIAVQLNYKTGDDLLAAFGRGDLGIQVIIHALHLPTEIATAHEVAKTAAKPKPSHIFTDIDIQGVGNLLTHIALCCKPVPGDSIIGYVTHGRGISIHRQDCINVEEFKKLHSEKMIEVNWGSKTQNRYPVDLQIKAHNNQELIKDITNIFVEENIPVLRVNSSVNADDNTVYIALTIEISGLAPLSKILAKIQQLPEIYEVGRII